MRELFRLDAPTGQIQAAWAAKECLRQLLDALPATDGPLVTDSRRDPDPAARPALRPYEIRLDWSASTSSPPMPTCPS